MSAGLQKPSNDLFRVLLSQKDEAEKAVATASRKGDEELEEAAELMLESLEDAIDKLCEFTTNLEVYHILQKGS
ncbi:hypothetical protein F373_gp123 [Bacillus phage SP-10]|uniref:hypothetical protein n=1 Tax=Bacillus phage SP10 TaxID=941058 RepID=UPI0002198B4F|nr:hypothetical protein F373_gp123 [Bacillus phage SP-10]BAK52935.1 hypothetical protein [Bacillus phage SP-10]